MKKKEREVIKKNFKEQINDFRQKAVALQKAVTELKAMGLNERVLMFAIQQAAQKHNNKYAPIGIAEIKAILQGLEGIENYLFPEEV